MGDDRDRDESGQYSDRVEPETVLEAFDERDDLARPLDAGEVADVVGIARRTALNKLNRLVDRGELETRKVGARGRVWWVPIEPEDLEASDDIDSDPSVSADPAPDRDHTVEISTGVGARTRSESVGDPGEPAEMRRGDVDDGLAEDVRAYIEEQDLPPKSEHGRDAVIDVFQLLREEETMGIGEIQSAVYPGYEEYWAGPRAMWNAIDRYLEEIPGLEKAGYGEWGYSGDDDVREAVAELE